MSQIKKVFTIVFTILLIFNGCSDETTIFDQQVNGKALVLEESNIVLSEGINKNNNGVLDIYFEHRISRNRIYGNSISGTGAINTDVVSDFHLNLVGQVSSPVFEGGSNLTATHVDHQGQYAYVSYNTVGETFAGAVDVIDLSNPTAPVLVSRMYMYNRDANVILYDNGYIYVLGSVDTEKVLDATERSFIAKIAVQDGIIVLDNVNYFYQKGNTATGITKIDNSFYVTSGSEGSIVKYDADTFSRSKEIAFNDLRFVASENGSLAILDGSTGISIMDTELNVLSRIRTSSSFVEDAKRTMEITSNRLIVAEGAQGAGIYNLNSGALLEHLPILINPENSIEADRVTNAVSVNGDATLLANGGAGLALSVRNDLIDLTGVVELQGSINYVVTDNEFIFAASGTSGLQIISKIRTDESLDIPAGTYNVRARHSGRVMSLRRFSTDDGIDIVQRSRNGLLSRDRWIIEQLSSGNYIFRNVHSNKTAQISETAGTANNVVQSEYIGDVSQQWVLEPAIDNGHYYIRNLSDNQYLEVFENATNNNADMITWPFHGGENQQWSFELIED